MTETMAPTRTMVVQRWIDPVVDAAGLRVDGAYAERFWLPVVGPTALWLLRRLAQLAGDETVAVDMVDLSQALGLGENVDSHRSRLRVSLGRVEGFGLGRRMPNRQDWQTRHYLAPLPLRFRIRLPAFLQAEHDAWSEVDR